ncbi:MAG: serine/threonine-protein kinase [Myxococcales bacterium]|nr:serine/threonine-protein kinase [Myxococcales bacterium]
MSDAFFQGELVGRYELVTRLSIGGMAELFLARLPGPGGFQKLVALKMILPDVRNDERFVQMFLDEARLSAELNHPNLGQVFDLGQQPSGELYLAMEFLSGQNFGAVMRAVERKGELLPLPVVGHIIRDVCLGLHAAHSHLDSSGKPRPVIHRDVAPKNVMVTFEGHVKVIDFGIAHAQGRRTRTQTGVVKGTPSHMAPEQLAGEVLTPATDVYAVGVMLHECLTGERLFSSDAPLARFAPPPRPSEKNENVSPALEAVCLKALAVEASERYQSARELAKALTEVLPTLADEEELSALMAALFPGQRSSIAKLAETARDPGQPSEQVSKLAREVFAAEATPAAPVISDDEPTRRRSAPRTTRPDAPAVPSSPPMSLRLKVGAGLGALTLLGLFAASAMSLEEPAPGPSGPFALRVTEQRPVGTPPPPPPRPTLPVVNNAFPDNPNDPQDLLIADAKDAIAGGNLKGAEQLLKRCKIAGEPCPRAEGLLAVLPDEIRYGELLDQASKALDRRDIERASAMLEGARETTMLVERYGRLKAREAQVLEAALVERTAVPRLALTAPSARASAPEPAPARDERTAKLLREATDAKKNGRYKQAISLLMECLARTPSDADCTVNLASTYATRGTKENNEEDNRKAKSFYESFLRVADPSDPRIDRVRQILRGF